MVASLGGSGAMYCPSCGTLLVEGGHFCHHCGTPAGGVMAPLPAVVACIQCGGAGRVHRSSMPHNNSGCIFCEACPGCDGSGAIPGAANVCPHCQGVGRIHESSMPHNDAGCIFCTDCRTCAKKGWL